MDLEDELETEAGDDAVVLVPMDQFELKTEGDDTFLQVMADAEKLRTAPTVTEEQLADVASHQQLREKVDSHFGAGSRATTIETPAEPQQDPAEEQPETNPAPE